MGKLHFALTKYNVEKLKVMAKLWLMTYRVSTGMNTVSVFDFELLARTFKLILFALSQ